MGFRIQLDIFSGLPNPEWTLTRSEAAQFLEQARDGALPIREPGDVDDVLGYRGFTVRATGTDATSMVKDGLPTRFRLAGTTSMRQSLPTERFLVDLAALRGRVSDSVAEAAADKIATTSTDSTGSPEAPSTGTMALGGITLASAAAADVCTFYLTSSTDYSFWNASSYIGTNNCYNFASNWRTNTFAQPGRGTGNMFSQLTVSNIKQAMARDGYVSSCIANNSLVACLVIWPGTDFHFYRRTVNRAGKTCWSHKPGRTAAKHTDNSGAQITSPSTCNRGPYTTYGGFMYVPKGALTTIS